MQRLVFCPSDDLINDASILSKKTSLPILIGDNDFSKKLEFDRSNIQVIFIPEVVSLVLSKKSVKVPFHQNITYTNEFFTLKQHLKLFINNELIKPIFEEKHRVYWNYQCLSEGTNFGKIFIDENEIEVFSFDSYK